MFLLGSMAGYALPARQLANLTPDLHDSSSLPSYLDYGPQRWADNFIVLNGIGYFAADDVEHGLELWRTDGSPEGTRMVIDLHPGAESSGIDSLIAGENLFYFCAFSEEGAVRLYRSDGTAEGTYPVRDEAAFGPDNRVRRLPLGIIGDQLIFSAILQNETENRGLELWTTDGTGPGTRLVKELAPGGLDGTKTVFASSRPGATLNGKVFFAGRSSQAEGFQLWSTDGTAAGTQLLKRLSTPENATATTSEMGAQPQNFLAADGLVFFTATSEQGVEWWRTDGTPEGTFMLPPFAPESETGSDFPFDTTWRGAHAIAVGPLLYYSMQRFDQDGAFYDSVPGIAVSDGTTNGTRALRFNLITGTVPVESAGKAWFLAFDSLSGPSSGRHYGLWVVTAEECRFVASVHTDSRLQSAVGKVYCINPAGGLQCIDAVTEEVLYGEAEWNETDGSWTVSSPLLTAGPLSLSHFAPLGDQLFFALDSEEDGREPWVTDGTPTGTRMLRDISRYGGDSYDHSGQRPDLVFLDSASTVYFPARYDWEDQTYQLMRYRLKAGGVDELDHFLKLEGNYSWGAELDGAIVCALAPERSAATQLQLIRGSTVSPLITEEGPALPARPFGFTRAGTNVFFFGYNATNSLELWRTAGTAGTTAMLKNLGTPADLPVGSLTNIVVAGDRLYFLLQYNMATPGLLLNAQHAFFTSDGTIEGTYTLVSGGILISPLTSAATNWIAPLSGGVVMCTSYGYRINDGTPSGTTAFNQFAGLAVERVLQVGDQLLFIAEDEEHGRGLWRTDGTAPGTYFISEEVTELESGVVWDGDTYFHGRAALHIIRQGETELETVFSHVLPFIGVTGKITATEEALYFQAYDPAHGTELWKSDGSMTGTVLVEDIWEGPNSSSPYGLRQLGTNLFFIGNNQQGLEPWIKPVSVAIPAQVAPRDFLAGLTGHPFHFQPTLLSGTVTHWRWRNLPAGLTFDSETGNISGVPLESGVYLATLDASNEGGVTVTHFSLGISDPDSARLSLIPQPITGEGLTLRVEIGVGLDFQILTSTDLIEWEVLPSWELNTTEEKRFFKIIVVGLVP